MTVIVELSKDRVGYTDHLTIQKVLSFDLTFNVFLSVCRMSVSADCNIYDDFLDHHTTYMYKSVW